MATDTRFLWNRGRGNRQAWSLRLPIPNPLRRRPPFSPDGKERPNVVVPLAESLTEAQRKRDELIPIYRRIFDRLLAGEVMTLEDIKGATVAVDVTRQLLRRALGTDETARSLDIRRILAEALEPDVARSLAERLVQGVALAPALAQPGAPAPSAPAVASETVSQAAAAMFAEMDRDGKRVTTIDGHKLRVRAFVEACGDIPLASITRATASDWLDKIGAERSNRTRNAYAMTMALVIETARKRGRYQGENPFDGMKAQAGGESYQAFTEVELATLFRALPREVKPAKHTPESALPWVALIAAYTGARLEEIAQLAAKDIREQQANGATITVIDIHNGGNNLLKNKASARLIPVHSELVRAGLLDYVKALPKGGPLFPGLVRRESKGGKIGARLGELFRKRLIALGLKREGLCFHSFRHLVAGKLEQAGVAQTDAARVLGHSIEGMSYGVYSTGPGLKRLAAVVEDIHYENI
jgi:integrase